MCIGGPKGSPQSMIPERQSVQQPVVDARAMSTDSEARRRGMLATILTSSAGAKGALATTANTPEVAPLKTKLG